MTEEMKRLAAENIALRSLLGAGCDANNEGPHSIVTRGSEQFCSACGETTRHGKTKAWFDEDRLARVIARATP